ncbi:MAG: hypothetical protein ACRCZ5_03315 [Burkholderiales bacterium]
MRPSRLLSCLTGLLFASGASAAQVMCHVSYGGETRTIAAQPSSDPYRIAPQAIGSLLMFRVVFEALPGAPPAVKIYSYVDRDEGIALIHQASYAHPAATRSQGEFGFTGQQAVYEPLRDGELQYWCEISSTKVKS